MRVAVTGASGFIGRHVVAQLLGRGCEVVALLREPARQPDEWAGRVEVVPFALGESGLGLYDRLRQPDGLIHLAWAGLPNYRSLHHFETELPRQYQFLSSLVREGLPAMLVAGTCFEYGMQSGMLSPAMPAMPANPYGYAKDALRRQLQMLQTEQDFNLVWGRIFYLYGDGQSAASLYPKLQEAVAAGATTFAMSGGEQLRDYLPVAEVARRIAVLALSNRNLGVQNICSGQPVSVRRLVEGWVEQNRWNITLNLGVYPYPDYEPMAFWGEDSFSLLFPEQAAQDEGEGV